MWFETLTGFQEETPEQVRGSLRLDGETITSIVNGRTMTCGTLETPSLAELRRRVRSGRSTGGRLRLSEIVADAKALHAQPDNAGALFQVASQFNLLEMISPSVSPEQGIDRYETDPTQGPACAIACGAGTIYRNYFAEVDSQIGQSSAHQIDGLRDLGIALGNEEERLWAMRNGYALASEAGLREIAARFEAASEVERDELRGLLRIGIQRNTEVTWGGAGHRVSQAYCSALPVAYSRFSSEQWAPFAKLVLEAAYEATLAAAALNRHRTGNRSVFVTLLGGGAFGNDDAWILAAMQRALNSFVDVDLDVSIVSYGSSKPRVKQLVDAW